MSTLKVNQIQNLNGDVLLSSSGGDANLTLSGELRGPATFVIDPAAVGDNTGTVQIKGNLQVDGTQTTINSTTLTVDDKNIVLADGATTDAAADGGGITLKGATDKTFNWVDSTDAWTSSEHINIASSKAFYINGTSVLSATTLGSTVTSSSLTSVGTITSGTWNATAIATNYIADDAVTGGKLADNITISTTSTITAANYTVTGSTAPTNGVYLPDTNKVSITTNNSDRLYIDNTGLIGIGTTDPGARLEVSSSSNWNFPNLILRRTASNINTNVAFLSFALGTAADGDDAIINPTDENVFFGLNTNATPGNSSTSDDLNAQLVINAPNGATIPYGKVGIGATSPNSKLAVNGSITESTDGGTTYHNVVTEQDIGTDPNQVPLNQFLGQLAFMDEVGDIPTSSTAPQENLSVNFEYVSNTSIKIRMRGSDGVVRSVTLTLS